MRVRVLIGIVVLLIISLLVGACAKTPAASPAPGKPNVTPTATLVTPITLEFSTSSAMQDETAMTPPDGCGCDHH